MLGSKKPPASTRNFLSSATYNEKQLAQNDQDAQDARSPISPPTHLGTQSYQLAKPSQHNIKMAITLQDLVVSDAEYRLLGANSNTDMRSLCQAA